MALEIQVLVQDRHNMWWVKPVNGIPAPFNNWISNDNKDIIKQLKKTVDIVKVIIKYFNIYNFKKTCKI